MHAGYNEVQELRRKTQEAVTESATHVALTREEAAGVLGYIESLTALIASVPFEEGDIVREVGEEEPTGEIIQITEGPHEKAYLVKLYDPPCSLGRPSINFYEDEIELIERPGK